MQTATVSREEAERIITTPAPLRKQKHEDAWREKATKYLGPMLPVGWSTYFEARRAGKYFGLTIECPVCNATPPEGMRYGNRRWRWLSVHLAEHKKGR